MMGFLSKYRKKNGKKKGIYNLCDLEAQSHQIKINTNNSWKFLRSGVSKTNYYEEYIQYCNGCTKNVHARLRRCTVNYIVRNWTGLKGK